MTNQIPSPNAQMTKNLGIRHLGIGILLEIRN